MGGKKIILSETDLYVGSMVGCRRNINDVLNGFGNRGVAKNRMWDVNINGALGELAFCRLFGIYFAATTEKPDKVDFLVGDLKVEIRTAYEATSRLIVRKGDLDDAAFVLMVGSQVEFEFVGWDWGVNCKDDRFLSAPAGRPPAWFVPGDELKGYEEFIKLLKV